MNRNKVTLIILVLILLVNTILICNLNKSFNLKNVFRPICKVENIQDLDKCYQSNKEIEVIIKDFYQTGYTFQKNSQVVAKFIDVDLSGKSIIALIPIEEFAKIKKGYVLKGRLEVFDDILKKNIINTIKNEYQIRMELNDIEIEKAFIPIQLNSYKYYNKNIINIILVTFCLISLTGISYLIIKMYRERLYEIK